jgi:hypothetical protein
VGRLKHYLMAQGSLRTRSVQDSLPTSLPRGDIMRLSTGRRAPRLMPPNDAGACRPLLERTAVGVFAAAINNYAG